jgi:transcriptional regulator with XRE-family HTH domain
MKFFQQTLLPDPLGPTLARARKSRRLSLEQAAQVAGISKEEALALEEDRLHDTVGMARLHALSYARTLGIDPEEIRDSLPPHPNLIRKKSEYLSSLAHSGENKTTFNPILISRVLAPLGKAAVFLLLLATFLTTWGMMRQLSRVRSIPWITSSSRPSTFQNR